MTWRPAPAPVEDGPVILADGLPADVFVTRFELDYAADVAESAAETRRVTGGDLADE